jgi:hypothetical protein
VQRLARDGLLQAKKKGYSNISMGVRLAGLVIAISASAACLLLIAVIVLAVLLRKRGSKCNKTVDRLVATRANARAVTAALSMKHSDLKVSVVIVGPVRPSVERVFKNLIANVTYFQRKFKNVEFVILTYVNAKSVALERKIKESQLLSQRNIKFVQIDPIEKSLDDHPRFMNTYRMFKSVSVGLSRVSSDADYIIRMRLDCEVITFNFRELDNLTYCSQYNPPGGITDNIGFAQANVMKRVWNPDNIRHLHPTNELILENIVRDFGYKIDTFAFEYNMYQTSDMISDGIPQFTRRSLRWISTDLKDVVLEYEL